MPDAFKNRPLLLPQIWALHGRWRANQPAVECVDGDLSWAALTERARRVANGLHALGLRKGDRVGTLMANQLAYAEVLMGLMLGGFCVVPLNPGSTPEALEAMLADCGARALFATPPYAARITPPADMAPAARLCAGDGEPGWVDYEAWRDGQSAAEPEVEIGPADLCNIIYSSGTTGEPKGIVHTHAQRLGWAQYTAGPLRYDAGARNLVVTGLHSNISWVPMLITWMMGGCLVVEKGFDAAAWGDLVERKRITNMTGVPVQYQRILEAGALDGRPFSTMKAMMCCGAPLPQAIKRAWLDAFPHGFVELYGSTEGVLTTQEPEEAPTRLASVGRPPAGCEIAIVGDDDRLVAPGASGEIVARTPFMMDGYWNRPEATAEATWIDDRGRPWLRSGDIGVVDEDGSLHVVDRKKDMILSGGQNVYPADIEAVLLAHPAVSECAVCAAPSDRWGETPVAFAVPRTGAEAEAEAMKAWLNERVGKFQRVDRVILREELPRNANGKILKRTLRAELFRA